ncbi:MAG TPA: hypothetical protein VNA25_25560, partial [Phycisphaerae bacterium]|nr:hypothetical protein [Phycisphaerae bacterium]
MPEGTEDKNGKVDLDAITNGFNEIKQSLEREKLARAELQGQLNGMKASAPAAPAQTPKRYSRAELQAAVDAGTITQANADGYIDQLRTEDLDRRLNDGIAKAKADILAESDVKAELNQYIESVPDIMVEGSEERNRVQAEYTELINKFGNPEGIRTQLLAVRNVMGPVRSGRTDLPSEREHDRTGAGGGDGKSAAVKNDPLGK